MFIHYKGLVFIIYKYHTLYKIYPLVIVIFPRNYLSFLCNLCISNLFLILPLSLSNLFNLITSSFRFFKVFFCCLSLDPFRCLTKPVIIKTAPTRINKKNFFQLTIVETTTTNTPKNHHVNLDISVIVYGPGGNSEEFTLLIQSPSYYSYIFLKPLGYQFSHLSFDNFQL